MTCRSSGKRLAACDRASLEKEHDKRETRQSDKTDVQRMKKCTDMEINEDEFYIPDGDKKTLSTVAEMSVALKLR